MSDLDHPVVTGRTPRSVILPPPCDTEHCACGDPAVSSLSSGHPACVACVLAETWHAPRDPVGCADAWPEVPPPARSVSGWWTIARCGR